MKTEPLNGFRAVSRSNAVEDVIASIQQALIRGDLQPSQRLPSEAQLGQQLGVGRGTIREAMKMLSAMGVVESRQGDGTYISDTISPNVINPLLFAVLIEAKNIDMLYEFRRMIDTAYMELAAEKATPEDFAHLEAVIEEMVNYWAEGGHDIDRLVQLDLNFHHAVLEATKNPLIVKIGRMLMAMFLETVKQSISTPDGVEWTINQHRRTLEALRSRDPIQVREAVIIGLEGSQTRQHHDRQGET